MSATSTERELVSSGQARTRTWRHIFMRRRGTLLDDVMPVYQFRSSVSVAVQAPPHRIFQALREVTLRDMPLAYLLGTLRYLPGRLTGRLTTETPTNEPLVHQLIAGGNVLLAEQRDREIVLGSIAKYHQILDQQWVPLKRRKEFASFNDPEYQKLAMSVRVAYDHQRGEHTLTLEHRTCALSESSQRKFGRYWFVIKPTGNFVSRVLLNAVKRRAEAKW